LKLLLHVCCANCAIYPLGVLREEGCEVMGFFYNPNIHPYQEYRQRLGAVREYETLADVKIVYRDSYDMEEFLRRVVFRESDRCRVCYHLRLEATARTARRGKFDAFTSTLLHSRHQDHELIREIGDAVGKAQGVFFLYRDFRDGWREGIKESHRLGLYRQQYCGCIYSEKERYMRRR